MRYRKLNRYKYQLVSQHTFHLPFNPPKDILTPFIKYELDGKLIVRKGYSWNGSNMSQDTKHCMRASLVHDILCQLIREGFLSYEYLEEANLLYRQMCIEDGMNPLRAELRLLGLRIGSKKAVESGVDDRVYEV